MPLRLLAVALAAIFVATTPVAAQSLTVMSFNVRYPSPDDGANVWEARRDQLIDTIRAVAPDIIGTQELYRRQGNDIVAQLPGYGWFGIDRRGGHGDEHMGIFYRRDRLTLIDMGEFWLSDTPEVAGSISWGHPYPRMVSWGLFETREGKRFRLYNTHFPYRPEDGAARTDAARLIAARIAADDGLPAILTGDFNTGPDSDAHAILTRDMADAWERAPRRQGLEPGFHGFKGGVVDRRIDWVLIRGFDVAAARSISATRDGRYPSDHYPMIATLRWPD